MQNVCLLYHCLLIKIVRHNFFSDFLDSDTLSLLVTSVRLFDPWNVGVFSNENNFVSLENFASGEIYFKFNRILLTGSNEKQSC